MSKCTDCLARRAPLFSIKISSFVLCVLILQPQSALTACDCTINRSVRVARDEHIYNKVNTIVTNITRAMQTVVATHSKNAFDLQGSLTSSYKSYGYGNLTDFVLRGGLDLWFDKDLPLEVSTKRLSVDINATVLNGSVSESGHTWYPAIVNFTTYLENEYVYVLYEKLFGNVRNVGTPIGIFPHTRYMFYPGINWVESSVSNTASVQSLCYCLANDSYSYKVSFAASISTVPARHRLSLLKTDTELAVDDYLSGMYETTYMHSAISFGFYVNNTWNVTMDVFFLGTANETASAFSQRLASIVTLPLRYANTTAKLLASPVVSNCMSRVVTYGLSYAYNYATLPCFTTTTSPLTSTTVSTTTSSPTVTPSPSPTAPSSAESTTSIPSSAASSNSTTETVPPTPSTIPTIVLATNTSTTLLPTTVPQIQDTLLSTTTVPTTILTTVPTTTVLAENTTMSPTSTLTTLVSAITNQTSSLDVSTNGNLAKTSTPAVSSIDTNQPLSFAPSTVVGSPNVSTSTSSTSSRTSKTTLKPVLEATTFDPDPFFKASVPVVTKIYNDEVLMKAMGTMGPLLWKPAFYVITIPAALGIVLAALVCMFCLQVNWITPVKKNHLLKPLPQ